LPISVTMATASYLSTKRTTNFGRLCRLVVDICTDVLRCLLTVSIPPYGLSAAIHSTATPSRLGAHQLNVVNPPGGLVNYDAFDITLLYTIIRNMVPPTSITPPTSGWGSHSQPGHLRLADDVERIREARNVLFAHVTTASISNSDFQ
jgi:hypothetical protein